MSKEQIMSELADEVLAMQPDASREWVMEELETRWANDLGEPEQIGAAELVTLRSAVGLPILH